MSTTDPAPAEETEPQEQDLLDIRIYPDPILREECSPVPQDEVAERIAPILDRMLATMYSASGIGLAAPQVGITERFYVIDPDPDRNMPLKLVNPEIVEKGGRDVGEEGCLSIPGLKGKVRRARYVKVRFLDETGEERLLEATDLAARVIQHELDHLNGVLFIDHVSSLKRMSLRKDLREMEEEWERKTEKPG